MGRVAKGYTCKARQGYEISSSQSLLVEGTCELVGTGLTDPTGGPAGGRPAGGEPALADTAGWLPELKRRWRDFSDVKHPVRLAGKVGGFSVSFNTPHDR